MKLAQVAAQLYTCRDLLKTPAGIADTLRRVRAIGYTAVQVSGMGPIAEEELVRILDGEGLTCCATHEPPKTILDSPEKVVERLRKLDCRITAYPNPAGVTISDHASVENLIKKLAHSGSVLRKAGQILCYHNHQHEFHRLNGSTVLDMIYDRTPPEDLQGEPDTYWVQFGGGDNVALCEKLKGRLPILHLKDYMITAESKIQLCEIGAGNLNFRKIIAAAEAAGCRWFVVEQDVCPGDPVDSLAQSFAYIRDHLVD